MAHPDDQFTRPMTFVTGNAGKLREVQALAPASMSLDSRSLELDEVQSLDLEKIVRHKLQQAYAAIGSAVIVEDTGAGLESLGGLPGPFVKFFVAELGSPALYRLSDKAADKVTVSCVAGYYDGSTMLFGNGAITGMVCEPRGSNGFGFDPTIIPDDQPDGQRLTMAEMPLETKNADSHRARAFRDLFSRIMEYHATRTTQTGLGETGRR